MPGKVVRVSAMGMILLVCLSVSVLAVDGRAGEKAGGPCTYDEYPGSATIVRITRNADGTSSRENYIVAFVFVPRDELNNDRAKAHFENHREQHLQYLGGANPGPAFLKKYKIEEGKKFACTLKVIAHGVCSPIVFTFDDIDLKDHDD